VRAGHRGPGRERKPDGGGILADTERRGVKYGDADDFVLGAAEPVARAALLHLPSPEGISGSLAS
jgi:hypothetical protein